MKTSASSGKSRSAQRHYYVAVKYGTKMFFFAGKQRRATVGAGVHSVIIM
jgi:hypothetical protein